MTPNQLVTLASTPPYYDPSHTPLNTKYPLIKEVKDYVVTFYNAGYTAIQVILIAMSLFCSALLFTCVIRDSAFKLGKIISKILPESTTNKLRNIPNIVIMIVWFVYTYIGYQIA